MPQNRFGTLALALVLGMALGAGILRLLAPQSDEAARPRAERQDWRAEVPVLRIGLLGGENEGDRVARFDRYQDYLESRLGIEVRGYPATDYAGVLQAMAAGQLEMAQLGPSGYAGLWLDTDGNVEPLVVTREVDGSLGYYAVMYVRADSPFQSIDDLRGHSLAFADPNSASGYLVPRASLRAEGKDPETYFSRAGFAGGHEQAVIAVLRGQYDAGVTWASGLGDVNEGYTRGNLRSMVEKGLLDMRDLRIIWKSQFLPNGPIAIRKDAPQELKDLLRGIHMILPYEDQALYDEISRGAGQGYDVVPHEFYAGMVEMRQQELAARRAR